MDRKVYVVGDSHASIFLPKLIELPCKSTTMYSASTDGILNFSNVDDNSVVVLSFGEIDVRCRIHQQVEKNRNIDEIVDEIVSKFSNALREQCKIHNKNLIFVFYSGPPISDVPNSPDNPEFPRRGTRKQRIFYQKKLFERISQECHNNPNMLFLDVHEMFATREGILSHYFWDKFTVHIDNRYGSLVVNVLDKLLYSHNIITRNLL